MLTLTGVVRLYSLDSHWFRFVETGGEIRSRQCDQKECFFFVPDERMQVRYEAEPVLGFALWYDGERVLLIGEISEMGYELLVEVACLRAEGWFHHNKRP